MIFCVFCGEVGELDTRLDRQVTGKRGAGNLFVLKVMSMTCSHLNPHIHIGRKGEVILFDL